MTRNCHSGISCSPSWISIWLVPLRVISKFNNPYIPLRGGGGGGGGGKRSYLQSQVDSPFYLWPDVYSGDLPAKKRVRSHMTPNFLPETRWKFTHILIDFACIFVYRNCVESMSEHCWVMYPSEIVFVPSCDYRGEQTVTVVIIKEQTNTTSRFLDMHGHGLFGLVRTSVVCKTM